MLEQSLSVLSLLVLFHYQRVIVYYIYNYFSVIKLKVYTWYNKKINSKSEYVKKNFLKVSKGSSFYFDFEIHRHGCIYIYILYICYILYIHVIYTHTCSHTRTHVSLSLFLLGLRNILLMIIDLCTETTLQNIFSLTFTYFPSYTTSRTGESIRVMGEISPAQSLPKWSNRNGFLY